MVYTPYHTLVVHRVVYTPYHTRVYTTLRGTPLIHPGIHHSERYTLSYTRVIHHSERYTLGYTRVNTTLRYTLGYTRVNTTLRYTLRREAKPLRRELFHPGM